MKTHKRETKHPAAGEKQMQHRTRKATSLTRGGSMPSAVLERSIHMQRPWRNGGNSTPTSCHHGLSLSSALASVDKHSAPRTRQHTCAEMNETTLAPHSSRETSPSKGLSTWTVSTLVGVMRSTPLRCILATKCNSLV